jgi:ribosome maturation factor RimP
MAKSPPKKSNAKKQPSLSAAQIESIIDQTFEVAEIIVSANYFVVDVTMAEEEGEWILRIYLDHPNEAVRVTVEDCKDISQALNPMIDEAIQELNDFPFVLEVSSPGLFRTLEKPREFNFYAGRRVEIQAQKESPYFATVLGFDASAQAIRLQRHDDQTTKEETLAWPQKDLTVSLSPDLTQDIELKTVPRRIERYD